MERTDEIAMMRDSDQWPRWPILPLKRNNGGFLETGRLMEHVVDPSAFSAPPLVNPWVENTVTGEQRVYSTFEQLYDDGWRID